MITLLGLNGGAYSIPADAAGSGFDPFRGPKTWLTKVYDFRQPDGGLSTNFQFTGLAESPMVWIALGAAGLIGFFLGKRM